MGSQRAVTGARAEHFWGKIDRRAIIDCRPPVTVGSIGARGCDHAVGFVRARLTARLLTVLTFAYPRRNFAYPSELEA